MLWRYHMNMEGKRLKGKLKYIFVGKRFTKSKWTFILF